MDVSFEQARTLLYAVEAPRMTDGTYVVAMYGVDVGHAWLLHDGYAEWEDLPTEEMPIGRGAFLVHKHDGRIEHVASGQVPNYDGPWVGDVSEDIDDSADDAPR